MAPTAFYSSTGFYRARSTNQHLVADTLPSTPTVRHDRRVTGPSGRATPSPWTINLLPDAQWQAVAA